MYLIWIFGSRLIRSNNQSSATLWILETCLIVGTPSLHDHLDHCFVVLKHIQQSFLMRKLNVWVNTVNVIQHVGFPLRSLTLVNDNGSPRSLSSLSHVSQNRNNQIAGIESGQTIQSQSSVQRDDFGFNWTVWNWSLFLTHTTCWNKCMTSKNAQCSSRSGFRILKISYKIGVLKQSLSELFCSVSHMTILFVFTCKMSVRNQSFQAFVTSLGPFCDGSCKFVHWP